MRGVIYTAIVGDKDQLFEPKHRLPNVDYICFTDNDTLQSPVWAFRPLTWTHQDPTRMARRVKILAHEYLPEYDWSLWVDGNMEIAGDLSPLVAHLDSGPFHGLWQFQRSCAYEEPIACIELKKDNPDILAAQVAKYRTLGMPEGLPVVATMALLRSHNHPDVVGVMDAWWQELESGSRRDQVSLPFILWQKPIDFRFFFDGGRPYWSEMEYLPRRPHKVRASYPWD